ncbi:UNVERIFIED_CONTAM: hypothetical protein Sangu_0334000 [Sesamum angustifolium]|uniref:Uncharacterized protein n=1 Tax=Sesamum angustifolium TaxID=2727405 RepID=A0AAW2QR21_9LAMI
MAYTIPQMLGERWSRRIVDSHRQLDIPYCPFIIGTLASLWLIDSTWKSSGYSSNMVMWRHAFCFRGTIGGGRVICVSAQGWLKTYREKMTGTVFLSTPIMIGHARQYLLSFWIKKSRCTFNLIRVWVSLTPNSIVLSRGSHLSATQISDIHFSAPSIICLLYEFLPRLMRLAFA